MKDNPTYGIIGNGRVARHFQHYFEQIDIPFQSWSRNHKESVEKTLEACNILLILIKDDSIDAFLNDHPLLVKKPCVHFSGALQTNMAQGAHPHFNFTQSLYDLDLYKKIPFVVEKGKYTFKELFPQLSNPNFELDNEKRAEYHALCVMCGNFPTMLWQEATKNYEAMGLPKDLFHLYVKNVANEFVKNPDSALTGPFVRKDMSTIIKNEDALTDPKLKEIYTAFIKVFT